MSLYVFNQQVQTAATEVIAQNMNAFNAASGGAIIMTNGAAAAGDWMESTLWAAIGNVVQRRNAYGAGNVTVQELTQLLERSVRVDGRVGPIKVTPALMARISKATKEAAATLATQASTAMIGDYLNTTVNVLVAAIKANPKAYSDQTAATATTPTLIGMQKACGLFGDAFGSLKAWIMDGIAYNELVTGDILKNASQLFQIGNVTIMQDGFGRRFVITDAPGLRDATAGTTNLLCLSAGAAAVQASGLQMYDAPKLGEENVSYLLQGEYDFVIGLKGYAWNNTTKANPKNTGDGGTAVADKGASPSDAELMKSANWPQIVTDVKNTAGVLVTFGKKP
ncbi:major capsid protein [Serratia phage Scapp]|uniref:Major capsid protein n=1 Tax=Serratia phage Scapp TaxID=2282409 RepID=A0A345L6P9_9CAUD|nr:major capsid protein [Serratia phage Scapp]AXH50951.1 major capsid protein [Serratia phage Scapp]